MAPPPLGLIPLNFHPYPWRKKLQCLAIYLLHVGFSRFDTDGHTDGLRDCRTRVDSLSRLNRMTCLQIRLH